MIRIESKNEDKEGFDLETRIKGSANVVVNQMLGILDKLYEATPGLFEIALLNSKYTKDHT